MDMEKANFREEQWGLTLRASGARLLRDCATFIHPTPAQEIDQETGVRLKPLKFMGFAEVARGCRFFGN